MPAFVSDNICVASGWRDGSGCVEGPGESMGFRVLSSEAGESAGKPVRNPAGGIQPANA